MKHEKIILAAINLNDNNCVVTCKRHADALVYLAKNGILGVNNLTQGFITSQGRFVDRAEAKKIAIKAGQIAESEFPQLYSEDLW
jgi:hypothetical protein